ncbi:MAG: envelope biogenesis factor ElyC [Desulfobulbaceae bacterium]|nr:envelope biogenesis factor ElyC [Desulfobulbaceae bacterium]
MIFMLKKIITPFLMPLPFSIVVALLGLFLLCFTKRERLGKILITFGIFLIAFLGISPVANTILGPLERTHPSYFGTDREIRYVVVLGGGHTTDTALPLTSRISHVSLTRLVEGIRIYRDHRMSRLVLSGWGGKDPVTNAAMMASVARAIGVPPEDIIVEPNPKDTKDEARLIKEIVGRSPFVLVTSASHMTRSMRLFKNQGLDPVPAPTAYRIKKTPNSFRSYVPSPYNLIKSERAVHEYLGLVWARLRGQI